MSVSITCNNCGKVFTVWESRKDTAKACSRSCSSALRIKSPNTKCANCGKPLRRKKLSLQKHKHHFCDQQCAGEFRKTQYSGSGNPNYRYRNHDNDGYRLYPPQASQKLGLGRVKFHTAMALISLGVKKIPKGYHVHHRDCDILNNDVENLALLTISDHVWLHKQFGSATLRALMHGEADFNQVVSWSDDPERAIRLLRYDVWTQGATRQLNEDRVDDSFEYCTSFEAPRFEFVEVDTLSETKRGEGGIGSTGK